MRSLAIDRALFAAAARRAPELVLGLSATLAGWLAPNTNVQLAPCHRPPSSIVSARFTYVRHGAPRLPPSEM